MIDEYLCIRVTDKNESTFSFPITMDSLEDYATMRLHEKLDFEKELSESVAVGSDGYFEFTRVNFEPDNVVDGIYFLKSDYVEIYERMSEYEKSVFKAYLKNERFDFKELNEVYTNFNASDELKEKVQAHDTQLEQFFELINIDDELKARIFEPVSIDVNRRQAVEKLNFLSARDAKNYELIEIAQKNLVFHHKSNAPIAPSAVAFALANKAVESEEVLKARYDRITSALMIGNAKLLFEYIEEQTIDLSKLSSSIITYDLKKNHGQIIDYLQSHAIAMNKNSTQSDNEKMFDVILNTYFDFIPKPKDINAPYLDFLEKKIKYFDFIGIDLGQENLLVLKDKMNLFCKLAITSYVSTNASSHREAIYYIPSELSNKDRKKSIDYTKDNYDLNLAYLDSCSKYFNKKDETKTEFKIFISKLPLLCIESYIYDLVQLKGSGNAVFDSIKACGLMHKIDSIYDFIHQENIECPKEIRNINSIVSSFFTQEWADKIKEEIEQYHTQNVEEINALGYSPEYKKNQIDEMVKLKDEKIQLINGLFKDTCTELLVLMEIKGIQAKLDKRMLEGSLRTGGLEAQNNLKI